MEVIECYYIGIWEILQHLFLKTKVIRTSYQNWRNLSCLIKTKSNLFFIESESMILSCDFFIDNSHIITTTLEGDINMHSVKDDLGIVRHETLIHPH